MLQKLTYIMSNNYKVTKFVTALDALVKYIVILSSKFFIAGRIDKKLHSYKSICCAVCDAVIVLSISNSYSMHCVMHMIQTIVAIWIWKFSMKVD